MANEKKATRAAYGETLIELANAGVPVVAVEADLSGSTTTKKLGDALPRASFQCRHCRAGHGRRCRRSFPDGKGCVHRLVCGIRHGRVYDQLRNTVCYANLDVKIAPTHAGVSVGPPTVAAIKWSKTSPLCACCPNMRVLVPADFAAAKAAIKLFAAETPGPSTSVWAAPRCLACTMRIRYSKSVARRFCARAATLPSSRAA